MPILHGGPFDGEDWEIPMINFYTGYFRIGLTPKYKIVAEKGLLPTNIEMKTVEYRYDFYDRKWTYHEPD